MNSSETDSSEVAKSHLPSTAHVEPAAQATQIYKLKPVHSFGGTLLMATILGIALVVPLVVVTYMQTPLFFTAVETLRIAPSDSTLVFKNRDASRFDLASYKIYKNTQRELILQPRFLYQVLKADKVAALPWVKEQMNPINWLARNIDIKTPDSSELMTVSLTLQDPIIAYRIVESVIDVYMSEVVEKNRLDRLNRIEHLERIVSEVEENERKKRSELHALMDVLETSDDGTINFVQQISMQQAALIRSELFKTEMELLQAKIEIDLQASLEKDSNKSPDVPDLSTDRVRLPIQIARLEKLKEQLRVELLTIQSENRKSGRSSIDVEMLRHEIESSRPIVERTRQELERSRIELQFQTRIMRFPSPGVPDFGDSTVRIRRTALAGLLGLLPAFSFLIWRLLNRRSHQSVFAV